MKNTTRTPRQNQRYEYFQRYSHDRFFFYRGVIDVLMKQEENYPYQKLRSVSARAGVKWMLKVEIGDESCLIRYISCQWMTCCDDNPWSRIIEKMLLTCDRMWRYRTCYIQLIVVRASSS